MSGCALLGEMTENLFIHMRAIRKITIHQDNRAARSVVDHMRIIEALERHDPELAERLAREHTLGLAAHVEQHGDFLDTTGDEVTARYPKKPSPPRKRGPRAYPWHEQGSERRSGGPWVPSPDGRPRGPFRGSRE